MKLERPIVFFDLETTGVDVVSDRIVQIGALKINPDGSEDEKNVLINPTIPIPKEASDVHGVSDEDVKGKPVFKQIAKSFLGWLEGCDLAGYNSDNFDIPLLAEEFYRVGLEYPTEDTHFIDVIKIERLINSHKLEDTYKRYTGETLEGAHDALADIKATYAIFKKQLEQNNEFQVSISEIETICRGNRNRVDFAGKLYSEDGLIYWNFGKHTGTLVSDTPNYINWALKQSFSQDTKKHLKQIQNDLNSKK